MLLRNIRDAVRNYANGTSGERLVNVAAAFIRRNYLVGEAEHDGNGRVFPEILIPDQSFMDPPDVRNSFRARVANQRCRKDRAGNHAIKTARESGKRFMALD